MAKNICPECDGELERTATKKKGMEVLKHKDPAKAKAAGCGMGFITVRTKGAPKNGTQETARTASQESNTGKGENERSGGGGYREAVRRSISGRGKSGKRSGRQRAQHDPEERAEQQPRTAAAKPAIPRGRWFDSVTKDIFGE